MTWIIDLIIGPIGWALGGIVTVAVAYFRGRSSGKKEVENEILKDRTEREAAGRDAVRDGRDSGLSPTKRVRRNDGDWSGL